MRSEEEIKADIGTAVYSFKFDVGNILIGFFAGFLDGITLGGDRYDTPTGSDHGTFSIESRTRMEGHTILQLVQPRHHLPFLIGFGITAGDQHDGDGCLFAFGIMHLIQRAVGTSVEHIGEVTLNAGHHRFSLRITHTDVVLDDVWIAVTIHESKEDKSDLPRWV